MAIEGIESKVLWGLAEVLVGGTVSRIKVYGEQVKGSLLGIYSPGDLAIFRPNGYVFSPEKYDSYCTFMAEENPDKKKLDGDDYIIIRNSIKPIPYYNLIEIKNISGKSIPLEKLQEIGVNRNLSDGTYYISITETKELVGPFKKDTNGLIPKIGQHVSVYNISQDFEKLVSIRGNNGTIFFNRPETIFEKKSNIDCMSNEQLKKWFVKKLREIQNISSDEEYAINATIEILQQKPLPSADDLDIDRFERIFSVYDQHRFSYEELTYLCAKEDFAIIREQIDDIRDDMYREIKDKAEEQIHLQLDLLHKEKTKLESEINTMLAEIGELKATKTDIEETVNYLSLNQDAFIQQLRLNVKLGLYDTSYNRKSIKPTVYEVPKENKSFSELNVALDYCNPLDVYNQMVKANLDRAGYDDTLIELFLDDENSIAKHQAVFIPCISWAYMFAQGIGNAKVYPLHVEHDWLHYKDFCENGLILIWEDAWKEQDKNHILVLENLNITQPECGCTPLLDVIAGYKPNLEGTSRGLPENLKIFATVIPFADENVGLKLSKRFFHRCWGQFGDFNDGKYLCALRNTKHEMGMYGYFEPKDLSALFYSTDNINKLGEPYFVD